VLNPGNKLQDVRGSGTGTSVTVTIAAPQVGSTVVIFVTSGLEPEAAPTDLTYVTQGASPAGGVGPFQYTKIYRREILSTSETSWTIDEATATSTWWLWRAVEWAGLATSVSPVVIGGGAGGADEGTGSHLAALTTADVGESGSAGRMDVVFMGSVAFQGPRSTGQMASTSIDAGIDSTVSDSAKVGATQTTALGGGTEGAVAYFEDYSDLTDWRENLDVTAAAVGTANAADQWWSILIAFASEGSPVLDPIVMCDGAEVGTHHGLTGGPTGSKRWDTFVGTHGTTIQVVTTPTAGAWSGYAYLGVQAGSAGYARQDTNTFGAGLGQAVFGGRIAYHSGSGVLVAAEFAASTGNPIQIVYNTTTQKFGVRFGTGGTVAYQSGTTATDAYVWIDLRVILNSTSWQIAWRIEQAGAMVVQTPPANLTGQSSSTWASWNIMANLAQTAQFYFDDLCVSNASIDYPLQRHKVIRLGVDTAVSAILAGSAGTNWQSIVNNANSGTNLTTVGVANIPALLDEVPPNFSGTADGIAAITANAADTVKVAMLTYTVGANERIDAVRILLAGWAASSATASLRMDADNGTTTTLVGAAVHSGFINTTTGSATVPGFYAENYPDTNGWTQTKLNALTVTIGFSTDATPDIGALAIYAEVAINTDFVSDVPKIASETFTLSESSSVDTGPVSKAGSDTGTLTESAPARALPSTDTAALSEAVGPQLVGSGADTGTLTEGAPAVASGGVDSFALSEGAPTYGPIFYRGGDSDSTAAVTTDVSVVIPADVLPGEIMLLKVTRSGTDATATTPAGWDLEAGPVDKGSVLRDYFYSRAVVAGDESDTVTSTWSVSSATRKHAHLLVYGGTGALELGDLTSFVETAAGTTHDAPSASVTVGGSWAVEFCTDRGSPGSTNLTPDAALVERQQEITTGGGGVTTSAADTGRPVPTGTYAGATWTGDLSTANAILWTAIVQPAAGSTPKAATDTGTLSESMVSAPAVAGVDTGTLGESVAPAPDLSRTDSATLSEGTPAVGLAGVDSAALTESGPALGLGTRTDTGTLTEGGPGLGLGTGVDTGTLTEGASALAATPSAVDTGTLSESASVSGGAVAKAGSETFAFAEDVAEIESVAADAEGTLTEARTTTAFLSRVDSATLSESTDLITGTTPKAASDTLNYSSTATTGRAIYGTDSGSLAAVVSETLITEAAADILLAGEAASINTPTQVGAETFTVTEAAAVPVGHARVDSAALSEGVPVLLRASTLAEALALLELPAAIIGLATRTDAAALAEVAFPTRPFAGVDTASFVEASAIVTPFDPPDDPAANRALDDLISDWFKARAPGVTSATTTADAMLAYFRIRSGLPANASLTDHMAAYYSGGLGDINEDAPLTDLEIAFWQAVDPTNNTGSWAQRARRFYAS
jgi:hypothetical protein